MQLLTELEALRASESFMFNLYGAALFDKWKKVKEEMQFVTEREYVSWLLEVVDHYKRDNGTNNKIEICNVNNDWTRIKPKTEPFVEETANILSDHEVSDNLVPSLQNSNKLQVEDGGQCDIKLQKMRNVCIKLERIHIPFGRIEKYASSVNNYEHTSKEEDLKKQNNNTTANKTKGRKHKIGLTKRYICPHCSYTSSSRYHRNHHIREVHERLKPQRCYFCSFTCSRYQVLKKHQISRHGLRSNYVCSMCGKNCTSGCELRKHNQSCQHPRNGTTRNTGKAGNKCSKEKLDVNNTLNQDPSMKNKLLPLFQKCKHED